MYALKLNEGGSMQEHIKMMTETFNDLSVVGDAISDEDRVVHLLASLPDSYNVLVTALEACAEVPSMEMVTERLLHEESKLTGTHGGDKAMTAARKEHSSGPRCYRCGQVGHVKRDCVNKRHSNKGKSKHKAHNTRSKTVECSDSDSAGLLMRHALSASSSVCNGWIIDTGATSHMCNDRSLFDKYTKLQKRQRVFLGNGHHLNAVGRGTVYVDLSSGDNQKCKLSNVLYVPDLSYNLLSVPQAMAKVDRTVFTSTKCEFLGADGTVVATGRRDGGLFYLNCGGKHVTAHVTQESDTLPEELWHKRYGHLGTKNMKKLVSGNMVIGLDCKPTGEYGVCKSCVEGKLHCRKFPKDGGSRSEAVLGLVHSDVCGKISTKSLSGREYFVTFIDDKTRYTWVYALKTKAQVFDCFLEWKAMAENQTGKQLKCLRSDNGGEYTAREFQDYLRKNGIRHEFSVPKTPEQNGVAERMNRTIVEAARCMLAEARLPRKFWAEAVSTAVFLRNRSPTVAVEGKTPYEALLGRKPHVNMLRVFGCLGYAHIPKDERRKFDTKARKCMLLGYGETTKGYRLYDMDRQKVIYSRDIVFDESKHAQEESMTDNSVPAGLVYMETDDESVVENVHNEMDQVEAPDIQGNLEQDDDPADHEEQIEVEEPVVDGARDKRPPERYGEWVYATRCAVEPSSVRDAMASTDKHAWKIAMEEEMKSLHDNDVWDLVELPAGRKTVGCKWVFKEKVRADGNVDRYKARLVAQGFSQQYGLDYDETFSPVVRTESVRTLIALAAQKNLLLHQMDVTTAFLNGILEEEVYMKQPEGFVVKGKEKMVCRLNKSIYGLKQSPRCWNAVLHEHLCKIGFTQSTSDPCIYTSDGELTILAVFVDDILLATSSTSRLDEVKQAIARKFTVKDMGELKYFLGVTVDQKTNPAVIGLCQSAYTRKLLQKFKMDGAKPVATPVDTSQKLMKADDDSELFDKGLYQSAVGSLLYLAMWTRPDIAYAVGMVSKYCSKPSKEHWTAVKRILRYLQGTVDYGLCYDKVSHSKCTGYSDADWAGDIDDRRSTSGYVFSMSGGAISWRSKRQTCVSLSTAEAEYIALASAAQEAVWLRRLLQDMKAAPSRPMIINEDNQSAIALTKNPQFHGRTKHVDIKFHYIREQVEQQNIKLVFCPSDNMMADFLTKGLTREKFCKNREMTGLKKLI